MSSIFLDQCSSTQILIKASLSQRYQHTPYIENAPWILKQIKRTHRSREAGKCKESKQWSVENAVWIENPKNWILVYILKNRTNLQSQVSKLLNISYLLTSENLKDQKRIRCRKLTAAIAVIVEVSKYT